MRDGDNIRAVERLDINWMGFIFYPGSPRFVPDEAKYYTAIQSCRKVRVGVFVNEDRDEILRKVMKYRLDYVQLHGDESADFCRRLQEDGCAVIKAFAISSEKDLHQTADYEPFVTHFLFDTKGSKWGGTGRRFDWSVLDAYRGGVPFLLSGGIGPEHIEDLAAFHHPLMVGVDLNSRFELSPAIKDTAEIDAFVRRIKKTVRKYKLSNNNIKMNRITQLFETKKSGILSVYFTAGYPALDDTRRALAALQSQGIDMVEIGIPFSDPMADGTVIQQANTQALRNGMSLRLLFEQLKDMRQTIRFPVILMGYLNPVMQFGFEAFCRSCVETGIDGVIIPDLPFADYLVDYKDIADRYALKIILLISPETSEERIRRIDHHTSGFIYMVSSASTTGAQNRFSTDVEDYFQRIHGMNLTNPQLIGFGIGNHETLQMAMKHASGAIVGSKFVELLGESANPEEAVTGLLKALEIVSCE